MISTIILGICFLGFLAFIYFNDKKNQQVEKDRFQELARALKSENVQEYMESAMTKGVLPGDDEDFEYEELDQVSPEELKKAINQQQDES